MKFKVGWSKLGGESVEVEAEDRWKAVVEASKLLGLDKAFPMSFLYKEASVKRPGKEALGRRKSLEEEERGSQVDQLGASLRGLEGEFGSLVGGECPICGESGILVPYESSGFKGDICRGCSSLLGVPKTFEVLLEDSPIEVLRLYLECLKGLTQDFASGRLGLREGFISFLRRRGEASRVEVEPWIRKVPRRRGGVVPKGEFKVVLEGGDE